jgi:hypothetical protein
MRCEAWQYQEHRTKESIVNQTMRIDAAEELKEALEGAPALHELEPGFSFRAQDIAQSPSKRRAFLQRMGLAGMGVAAIGLLNGCNGNDSGGPIVSPTATPTGSATPVPGVDQTNFPGIVGSSINFVVLNYALALETLEADLYRQALNVAAGLPIGTALKASTNYSLKVAAGGINTRAGSAAVAFKYLRDFAFVEATHRDFLRGAIRSLGGTTQPVNAGGYQFANGRTPGSDLRSILASLLPIEETGVRAYLGAAGFLTDLNLVQTAASIYSTEARHSAIVADAIGRVPGPVPQSGDKRVTSTYPSPDTFEYFLDPATVLNAIKPFLDTDNSNGVPA